MGMMGEQFLTARTVFTKGRSTMGAHDRVKWIPSMSASHHRKRMNESGCFRILWQGVYQILRMPKIFNRLILKPNHWRILMRFWPSLNQIRYVNPI
jgi:hypothetical protein